MLKIFAGLAMVVFIGVIGYTRIQTVPMTGRDVVEDAVQRARQGGPLSADEETLLRVQIALADYKSRNGRLPDNLADLVPHYFEAPPVDPKTKEPFAYRREGTMALLGEMTKKKMVKPGAAGGQEKKAEDDEISLLAKLVEERFVYDPSDRRDPFLPFNLGKATQGSCDPKEPLVCYKVGQLRVSAIIKDQAGELVAVLEDQVGKGFSVRKGTKIGERNGVVANVTTDKIEILQSETERYTGQLKQNVVELKLQSGVDPKKTTRVKKVRPNS